MIVLEILMATYSFLFYFFDDDNDLLIAFTWNFRFIRGSHADWLSESLYKYLAFSLVATPRTN